MRRCHHIKIRTPCALRYSFGVHSYKPLHELTQSNSFGTKVNTRYLELAVRSGSNTFEVSIVFFYLLRKKVQHRLPFR